MNKVILFLLCLISTMYMAAQMQSPVGVTWQLDSSDTANRTYRCHFTMEIIDAIRSVAGPRFPITYRYAVEHKFKGGRSMEEGLKILEILDRCGIDAFDLDVGSYENLDYIFPIGAVSE